MRTWFFYSVPGSTVPSPYFKRVPAMLADLSKKGILRFRLWQGRHEAPIPLSDGQEPIPSEEGGRATGGGNISPAGAKR